MYRLILVMESRIRRNVYVRFGGEYLETYCSNTTTRRILSLLDLCDQTPLNPDSHIDNYITSTAPHNKPED